MALSKQQLIVPLLVLASSLIFGMGTAQCSGGEPCLVTDSQPCGGTSECYCMPIALIAGVCIHGNSLSLPEVAKGVEAHPNLCKSHEECLKKGSGDFCARFPSPRVVHGWCIDSSFAPNGLLKMITDK